MPKTKIDFILSEDQMELIDFDLSIRRLGDCIYDTTSKFSLNKKDDRIRYVPDDERVLAIIDKTKVDCFIKNKIPVPSFEKAGERNKLYFEPGFTVSAIVTCGGLCPGSIP